MRQDQIERLRTLAEKLADVVLEEADPDMWPGTGMPLADMTKDQRGDRFWCKKNAAATFALLQRTESVLNPTVPDGGPKPSADVEHDIAQAERMAAKALETARARSAWLVKRSQAGG